MLLKGLIMQKTYLKLAKTTNQKQSKLNQCFSNFNNNNNPLFNNDPILHTMIQIVFFVTYQPNLTPEFFFFFHLSYNSAFQSIHKCYN